MVRLNPFSRRKLEPTPWQAEPERDDSWEHVRRPSKRQAHGPINAPLRNKQRGVSTGHENRAGHRQYVRDLQSRQGRINIVGWGKWRRHKDRTEESVAWVTRLPHQLASRQERRAYAKANKYRGQ